MSYAVYKSLHLGSLFLLFFSLGGLWLLYSVERVGAGFKKPLFILHGISWFVVVVAGFGLIARLGTAFPWPLWIYIKLLIGILLGFAPLLFQKTIKKSGQKGIIAQGVFLFIMFLIVAAVFTVYKRF